MPFVLSVLVRRPLVGLAYEFLDPTPGAGRHAVAPPPRSAASRTRSRPSIGAALFLARGFVQLALYGENATGWLAFARIAMGYPLFVARGRLRAGG